MRSLARLTLALTLLPYVPNASAQCFTTYYFETNGGAVGGALYFDLRVHVPVTIQSLETSFDPINSPAGSSVGIEIYLRPGTFWGNTSSNAGWTLAAVDDGTALASGTVNTPTAIDLASPLTLASGDYAVALVAVGASHDYTDNGCDPSGVWPGLHMLMTCGGASNVPFSGPVFAPRTWNGSFCYTLGEPYCGPAVLNSSGLAGETSMSWTFTPPQSVELTVGAERLPANVTGYFLVSDTRGFVPAAGGSAGNLCLSGEIGRYVGPGQVQSSSAAGRAALLLDLGTTPTPTGPVVAVSGETWNWQFWHRDVGGTSNFTSGVSVVLP